MAIQLNTECRTLVVDLISETRDVPDTFVRVPPRHLRLLTEEDAARQTAKSQTKSTLNEAFIHKHGTAVWVASGCTGGLVVEYPQSG